MIDQTSSPTKCCTKCKETKQLSEFYKNKARKDGHADWCKECHRPVSRATMRRLLTADPEKFRKRRNTWRAANLEKARAIDRAYQQSVPTKTRNDRYLRKYGITIADYDAMFERQNGGCAICGRDTPGGRGNYFHIDHCHSTGAVRGLLCHGCNTSLGHFGDSIETLKAAIVYLRTPPNHAP